MSHAPERTEKNCLNCGTTVIGRFCHVCGQENVVPKETFWKLVVHFFYDITHFDSRFFHSLQYLFLRPGFLPKEYISGRRASYLNPIRMYVFTSAFFFVIFFTLFKPDDAIHWNINQNLTPAERDSIATNIEKDLVLSGKDSVLLATRLAKLRDTSATLTLGDLYEGTEEISLVTDREHRYKTVAEYDSVQRSLSSKDRDGWFTRQAHKKQIELDNRFRGRPGEALTAISEEILHKLPYLLFVSLPLFALILKLLYVRHKEFYYADHGIFTIYHYIFSFLLLLVIFVFDKLDDLTHLGIFDFLIGAAVLAWLFYLYKGMRNFYGQRRGKTVLKYILLNLAALVMNIILLVLFFFLSVFSL